MGGCQPWESIRLFVVCVQHRRGLLASSPLNLARPHVLPTAHSAPQFKRGICRPPSLSQPRSLAHCCAAAAAAAASSTASHHGSAGRPAWL